MLRDPIVDEVRRIREHEAAKHGFDIKAILAAAKKRQRRSRRKVVSFAPGQHDPKPQRPSSKTRPAVSKLTLPCPAGFHIGDIRRPSSLHFLRQRFVSEFQPFQIDAVALDSSNASCACSTNNRALVDEEC